MEQIYGLDPRPYISSSLSSQSKHKVVQWTDQAVSKVPKGETARITNIYEKEQWGEVTVALTGYQRLC